jgi:hypothetical protein
MSGCGRSTTWGCGMSIPPLWSTRSRFEPLWTALRRCVRPRPRAYAARTLTGRAAPSSQGRATRLVGPDWHTGPPAGTGTLGPFMRALHANASLRRAIDRIGFHYPHRFTPDRASGVYAALPAPVWASEESSTVRLPWSPRPGAPGSGMQRADAPRVDRTGRHA